MKLFSKKHARFGVRRLGAGTVMLEGESIDLADVALEQELVESRGPTVASQSSVEGVGLTASVVRQLSSFTVEACDADGERQGRGGDPIFVSIRGCGVRVHCKVSDEGDGTYTCTYRTEVSGPYKIIVSIYGEALPGSPFTMMATTPSPVAEQCILRGESLTRAVARVPQTIECEFRDASGNVAHAEELNVYVVRHDEAAAARARGIVRGSRGGTDDAEYVAMLAQQKAAMAVGAAGGAALEGGGGNAIQQGGMGGAALGVRLGG